MATSRRPPAADAGTSTRERADTASTSAFGMPTSLRTRSYTVEGGNVQGGGSRRDGGGSRKKETLKESIWDGLRRTDVKAIDDGLHGLSSSVQVNIGLMSFSDAEDDDDDDDDDDDESTDSGGKKHGGGLGNAAFVPPGNGQAAASDGRSRTGSSGSRSSGRLPRQRSKGGARGGGGGGGGGALMSKGVAGGMNPLQELSMARAASSATGGEGDSDSDSDWDAPWAVIKVRSEKEIIKSLDPRFFVEDYDPVKALLEELPDLGPIGGGDGALKRLQSSGSVSSSLGRGDPVAGSYDEYLERQLRDMDVARVAVTRQIASMVQENYTALVGGMRQVQAVDLDLARAGVQVSNGRRRLQRALARVTGPVLELVRTDCRRERLRSVLALTVGVNEAFSTLGKVEDDLAAGRFTEAVARAEMLGEIVRAGSELSRLVILGGVRDRTAGIMDEVRERAKLALGPLCQTFSPEGYGGIIRAYLLLEDRGVIATPTSAETPSSGGRGEGEHKANGNAKNEHSCRWITKGLADCALPLPSSLSAAVSPTAFVGRDAAEADGPLSTQRPGNAATLSATRNRPSESAAARGGGPLVASGSLPSAPLVHGAGMARTQLVPGNVLSGMEMLADHMLSSFVDEFNRMLSDAIFEALIIDQGLEESHGGRRSRRAFEPAPPLFLPAPQLLEGIVQICHGAAELLHSYFCCTQWHASAFDERLEDDAFLHTQTLPPPAAIQQPDSSMPSGVASTAGTTGVAVRGGGEGDHLRMRKGVTNGAASQEIAVGGDEARAGIGDYSSDPRVDVLRKLLLRQRRKLWEEIENKMITLLSEASVGGGALELEDLAGVVGAVGLLATLGDEFVGDSDRCGVEVGAGGGGGEGGGGGGGGGGHANDGELSGKERDSAGRALRECLSEKAKEFFQGANKEGVTVLKQMIEMEAWQRVPMPSQAEIGGVGGLIDNNAMRFCSPHRVYRGIRRPYLYLMHDVMSLDPTNRHNHYQQEQQHVYRVGVDGVGVDGETRSASQPPQPKQLQPRPQSQRHQQPLLRGWHLRGNPFRILGQGHTASRDGSAEASPADVVAKGMAGVGLGRLPAGIGVDDDPDSFGWVGLGVGEEQGGGGGNGVGGGRGGASLHDELEEEEKRYGSGWVVTQAALNGVARYAGHALQIMALVRPAAPSAFEGLQQLVDLYMYCAFTLFCPQWAIDALYGFGDEELVPPPEEQESLAVLKSFMSRVSRHLNCPTSISRGPSPQGSPERPADARGGRHSTGESGNRRPRARSTNATAAEKIHSTEDINWSDPLGLACHGSPASTSTSQSNPRGHRTRASLDSAPYPAAAGGGSVGVGSADAGTRENDVMGDLWPFRGPGSADSPARSRAGSATMNHGLFARRPEPTRHPTPRAPMSLPACMAAATAPKLGEGLEGLLSASDALWGGAGEGTDRGLVEKTMEWMSLGERAVAIESCLFVIQILKAARRRTVGLGLLPLSQRAAVDAYVEEAEMAATQLRTFAYRAQGPGLAGHAEIVTAVEGQSWTLKQLRNDASPYVEKAIKRCRLVRAAIAHRPLPMATVAATANRTPSDPTSTLSTGHPSSPNSEAPAETKGIAVGSEGPETVKIKEAVVVAHVVGDRRASSPTPTALRKDGRATLVPARARRLAWRGVVDACLLALLRGFSRVKRCSTEGRALMSMDLQALALGLEDPAAAQTAKAHVRAYVNAFYFGEEDLLKWIKERWRGYPMYQMVSLLQCGDRSAASGVFRKRRVKDLVVQVEALYHRGIATTDTNPQSYNKTDGAMPPKSSTTTTTMTHNADNTSAPPVVPSSAWLAPRAGAGSAPVKADVVRQTVGKYGDNNVGSINTASETGGGGRGVGKDVSGDVDPSQSPPSTTCNLTVEVPPVAPSPAPLPLEKTPREGIKGDKTRKSFLRVGGGGGIGGIGGMSEGISPPRIGMVTNPFRRAVDKINGAMTSAENALVKKATALTDPTPGSSSRDGGHGGGTALDHAVGTKHGNSKCGTVGGKNEVGTTLPVVGEGGGPSDQVAMRGRTSVSLSLALGSELDSTNGVVEEVSGEEPKGDNGKSEIGPLIGDGNSGSAVALPIGVQSNSRLSVAAASADAAESSLLGGE